MNGNYNKRKINKTQQKTHQFPTTYTLHFPTNLFKHIKSVNCISPTENRMTEWIERLPLLLHFVESSIQGQ